MISMLVLLRQHKTKLYYGVHGEWAPEISAAAHFETVEEALLANRQAHLQGTEVFVLHSNGRHKVVLPLGKESWTSRHWNAPGSAIHSRSRNQRYPAHPGAGGFASGAKTSKRPHPNRGVGFLPPR